MLSDAKGRELCDSMLRLLEHVPGDVVAHFVCSILASMAEGLGIGATSFSMQNEAGDREVLVMAVTTSADDLLLARAHEFCELITVMFERMKGGMQ